MKLSDKKVYESPQTKIVTMAPQHVIAESFITKPGSWSMDTDDGFFSSRTIEERGLFD